MKFILFMFLPISANAAYVGNPNALDNKVAVLNTSTQTLAANSLPYSGATQDTDLNGHSITAAGVVASTVTTTSTASVATLLVSGAADFNSAISTATMNFVQISTLTVPANGIVDVGMTTISSSCYVPAGVPTNCFATCPAGYYAVSGGYANNSYIAPSAHYKYGVVQWIGQTYHATTPSTTSVFVYCGRIKS